MFFTGVEGVLFFQVEADLLRPAVEKENEIRAYSVSGMPSAMFSTPVSQLIAQLAESCASALGMPQLNHTVNPVLDLFNFCPLSFQCSQNPQPLVLSL